ncbi:tail protein X [Lelliottia sp. SL45]|uniref:tail protein X n=1 Tax=Lelliottia sp. SL45 TaxID=2994665 RepID=UPI002275F7B9|nr:tail protein X [Lelliottia sp. SL45]MCY1697159.1 tail protein X [Lelliottia sp. SL45]
MRNTHSLQGERWDQLCYRIYGAVSEEAVISLRHANPAVVKAQTGFVLPAGYPVTVPELTVENVVTEEVAPWQR